MMFLSDSHLHTHYSPDADQGKGGEIDAICEAAIEKGFSSISITDHYELGYGKYAWVHGFTDRLKRKDDIYAAKEKYSGRLHINFGVEFAQPGYDRAEADALLSDGYEYVLGSIHSVCPGFDFFFVDYKKLPPDNFTLMFEKYLDDYLNMTKLPFVHTCAHLTYPVRYAAKNQLPYDIGLFREKIGEIFKSIIESGKTLEVNTSPLRKGMTMTMPDSDLLAFYRSLGGELITIGSDAHKAADVGTNIVVTLETLKQIGFKYLTHYENGKPLQNKII